jgi:hypothetical protein
MGMLDIIVVDKTGTEIEHVEIGHRSFIQFQDALVENHPHLISHQNNSVRKGARIFAQHFGFPASLNGKQGRRILAFLAQVASETEHPVVRKARLPYYAIIWFQDNAEAMAYHMEDMLRIFRALATSRRNKLHLIF